MVLFYTLEYKPCNWPYEERDVIAYSQLYRNARASTECSKPNARVGSLVKGLPTDKRRDLGGGYTHLLFIEKNRQIYTSEKIMLSVDTMRLSTLFSRTSK